MKLLGWMHSKFRQGNGDAFRDYSIGSTCNCLTGILSKDEQQYSPIIISPIATNSRSLKEQDIFIEDALLFEGLLSIGTLGIQPIQEEEEEYMQEDEVEQPQEYETKTTLKAIAEKEEDEMTSESELMAVNKELEKVLTEVADMEGDRMSSARPSHFTGNVNEACPLQEFLFGAAAVVDVGSEKKKKEKEKEKRASLVELFMIEEGNDVKKEKKGEHGGKKGNKLTKLLLKRSEGKVGGGDVDGGGGAGKDASVKTAKFNKILRIFHKKIHPDNDTATPKKQAKSSKYKSKQVKESSLISSNVFGNRCSFLSVDGSDSADSSEHWIKTDADFLVLEIQKGITSAAD